MFKFSGLRPNVVFMQLHKQQQQQQQQCEPADIAAASSFSRRCLFALFVLVCHRARNGLWASRYARSRNTKSKPNSKLYIQQCSSKPPLGPATWEAAAVAERQPWRLRSTSFIGKILSFFFMILLLKISLLIASFPSGGWGYAPKFRKIKQVGIEKQIETIQFCIFCLFSNLALAISTTSQL